MINDPVRLVKRAVLLSVQLFFAVLLLSWHSTPALAHPSASASDYAKATSLLTQGKNFEQAITLLQAAVKADPKNAGYHLALGCAYADRGASVFWAMAGTQALTDFKVKYPKELSDWESAQKDPKNSNYGLARPEAPPKQVFIKDDGKPFTITQDQAITLADQLSKNALAEWEEGARLIHPGQKHAFAEYIRGWGTLMVAPLLKNASRNSIIGFPENADAAKAFELAANKSPTNVTYWGALAYTGNKTQRETAIDRGLTLDPHNPALLYDRYDYLNESSFLVEMRNSEPGHFKDVPANLKPATPQQIQSALQSAANAGSDNAYLQYLLARTLFDQTNYKNNAMNDPDVGDKTVTRDQATEQMVRSLTPDDRRLATVAFETMKRGNNAPDFDIPPFRPPVPSMLRVAWGYGWLHTNMFDIVSWGTLGPLRELARDAAGYADAAAMQHGLAATRAADEAVIAMGYRFLGRWPVSVRSNAGPDNSKLIVGMAMVSIGYHDLVVNLKEFGTPAQAEAVQVKFDAFEAQAMSYKRSEWNYIENFNAIYY